MGLLSEKKVDKQMVISPMYYYSLSGRNSQQWSFIPVAQARNTCKIRDVAIEHLVQQRTPQWQCHETSAVPIIVQNHGDHGADTWASFCTYIQTHPPSTSRIH